ncbi:hypothetical protein CC78DRAFT_575913 [Lojkania enalia]|uniref:Uncharacterized protein n=1 Tax=Lojkania enalia TaxID=147567 RepID=A0A9P4N744_9PLEO|nr:hypothetical protein CC78DRAFT_575913 [Didymosphaeria enalia]
MAPTPSPRSWFTTLHSSGRIRLDQYGAKAARRSAWNNTTKESPSRPPRATVSLPRARPPRMTASEKQAAQGAERVKRTLNSAAPQHRSTVAASLSPSLSMSVEQRTALCSAVFRCCNPRSKEATECGGGRSA